MEDLGGDIVDENELVPDYFIDRPVNILKNKKLEIFLYKWIKLF